MSSVRSQPTAVAAPSPAQEPKVQSGFRRSLDNRWLRAFFIYLGLMLMASAYSNWQPLFLILNQMGAYGWICDEDSSHENDFAICDEQYDYMSQIYSVAGNMAYIIGLAAGFLMDAVGGRKTMAFGVVVVLLGWIMIIASSEELPMYWPGMIFLGCAENLMGFPGFQAGKFFPMVQDLCASLCIAMQMLSSWAPAVIWAIVEGSTNETAGRDSLILYVVICAVPAILMIASTPGRKSHWILNPPQKKKKVDANLSRSSSSSLSIEEEPQSDLTITSATNYKSWTYWKTFLSLCATVDFVLFTIWYIILTLALQFYNTKIMEHAGSEIGEFIGILNPFRAFIGPIMGGVSDLIGAFPMIIVDNCFLTLAFGLSLLPSMEAYYASAVFYILARSFAFTTKYIYVQNFYPAEHFGKLSGIISFLGGTFGFLNVWFQVLPYDTQSEFAFCTAVSLIITAVPIYLLVKHRKLVKLSAENVVADSHATVDKLEKADLTDSSSSSDDEPLEA